MRRAAGVVTQSQRHNSVTRPAAYTAWKGEWMIMHRSDLRTSSIPQRYQRARLLAAASAACLLLMPAIASAQAIGGTVTDSTGGVLPGVTVEARSPALIEQVRTAVTDGNGQFLIIALETGTYSVTFTLPGFSTLIREGVELSTGFTANIDAQMAVGGLEETIIVREANPIIDVQSVRQSETIGREIFELLPTTRGYDSLALLIPAMNIQGGPSTAVPIDTGGVSGRSSNRLTIHGSDEYDSEVNIDGFDAGNVAFEGAPSFQPFDTAIAEYVYDYSSNAAEVETGGVRMNMIPKEGSNRFSGGFYGNFGHSSWLANNVDQDLIDRGITGGKDGAFRSDQSWQLGPSLGGPIVRDRLWFYLSYSYRRASFFPSGLFDNADTSAFTYVPNLDDPTLEASNTQEATGRLTWQATVRDKVQAFFTKNNTFQYPALTGSQLFPIYIAPEAGSEANTTFHAYQLSWTRPQTNRILFEAGFATMPNVSDLFALNNSYGASGAGAHFDARTDLPGIFNAANLTMSRNMGFIFRGSTVHFSRMTRSARASVSYVTGSHNLKVGFTSNLKRQLEAYQSESNWTNIMTYFGSPIRAIYESRGPETNELTNVGIYAQDQWTIDRLTVNAGVRFDYFSRRLSRSWVAPGRRNASGLGGADHFRRGDSHELEGPPAAAGRGVRLGGQRPHGHQGIRLALRQPRRHLPGRRAQPDREQHPIVPDLDRLRLPRSRGVHPRRRAAAGRPLESGAQRRAAERNRQSGLCPGGHHPSLRPRLGLRLGGEEGQLGVHGERPARTARKRVGGLRVLPAHLHKFRCMGQSSRRT